MAGHRAMWKLAGLDFTGSLKNNSERSIAVAVTRPADGESCMPLLCRYQSCRAITVYQGIEEGDVGTAPRH
jgi:hypothetical protein